MLDPTTVMYPFCGVALVPLFGLLYHLRNKTGQCVCRGLEGPKSPKMWFLSGDLFAPLIYKEIYLDTCYFKHGVTLSNVKTPFIVDVGGNIGLFSRWCLERFPTATVHCIEAIPDLCACIHRNVEAHKDRAVVHCVGVSSKAGRAEFTFDSTSTAGCSMFYTDLLSPSKSHGTFSILAAVVYDGRHAYPRLSGVFAALAYAFRTPVLNVFALAVFSGCILLKSLFDLFAPRAKKSVPCLLRSLDEILITDGGVDPDALPAIDLLKIDVEAAEWEALAGLSDRFWPKVKQVVVEVSNIDNRVEKVVALFREKGFTNIVVDVEDWEIHKIFDIKTVFATRE